MHLLAVHQTRRNALLHRAHEQIAKHLPPPARPRLGQHTVIGHLLIQAVTQEPQVIHPFPDHSHQLAFTGHIVQKKQQQHLYQNDGVGPYMSIAAVELLDRRTHKRQVQNAMNPPQRMIRAHALLKVDLIVEQLVLCLLDAHHSYPFQTLTLLKGFITRFGQHALSSAATDLLEVL